MNIYAAVIGASGYSGAELLRLLAGHPSIKPQVLTAESQAGKRVGELYPHLAPYADERFQKFEDCEDRIAECQVVFCALPHCKAMSILPGLKNKLVVDLGGDFRLTDPAEYERWYGHAHTAPAELGRWTYGLPEFFREQIRAATRIANPGCSSSAAIFALAPLVKADLVEGLFVIDVLSGLSGAGRDPKPSLHFSHAVDDVRAYKVAVHQHTPEIELGIERYAHKKVTVSFTPHLVPMARGIHATCSASARKGVGQAEVNAAFAAAYANERFVRVSEQRLGTKDVRGSNLVSITPTFDARTGRVIVTSVLDNLVKGAAGQALQNANLALGLDEALGLSTMGLYP